MRVGDPTYAAGSWPGLLIALVGIRVVEFETAIGALVFTCPSNSERKPHQERTEFTPPTNGIHTASERNPHHEGTGTAPPKGNGGRL